MSSPADGLPLPPTTKHSSWEKISVHTAKCDLCHLHNTSVMQRCKKCNQQVCKTCIEKVHEDNTHEVTGELDWKPGPSPAAPSARRQHRTPRKETPEKTPKSSSDRVLSSSANPSRVSKRPSRTASQNVSYYREEVEEYPEEYDDGDYEEEVVHSGGVRRANQPQRNDNSYRSSMYDPSRLSRVGQQALVSHHGQRKRSYPVNSPRISQPARSRPAGYTLEDPFTSAPVRPQEPQYYTRPTSTSTSGRKLVGPPRDFHYPEEEDRRYEDEVLAMHSDPREESRYYGQSRQDEEGDYVQHSRSYENGGLAKESRYAEQGGHVRHNRSRETSRYGGDDRYPEEVRYIQENVPRQDSRSDMRGASRPVNIRSRQEGRYTNDNRSPEQGRPRVDHPPVGQQDEVAALDARIAEIRHEYGEFPDIMELLDAGEIEQAEQMVGACEALMRGGEE